MVLVGEWLYAALGAVGQRKTPMEMLSLPLWGQLSILGLSLGLNVYVFIRFILGGWVPATHLDRAQATTDTFRQAWETSQQTQYESAKLVTQLTVTATTLEKLVNALPQVHTARVVVARDESGDSA